MKCREQAGGGCSQTVLRRSRTAAKRSRRAARVRYYGYPFAGQARNNESKQQIEQQSRVMHGSSCGLWGSCRADIKLAAGAGYARTHNGCTIHGEMRTSYRANADVCQVHPKHHCTSCTGPHARSHRRLVVVWLSTNTANPAPAKPYRLQPAPGRVTCV